MELRNSLKMYTSYIYTENSFLVFILKESLSGIYKLMLYLFPVTQYIMQGVGMPSAQT